VPDVDIIVGFYWKIENILDKRFKFLKKSLSYENGLDLMRMVS